MLLSIYCVTKQQSHSAIAPSNWPTPLDYDLLFSRIVNMTQRADTGFSGEKVGLDASG